MHVNTKIINQNCHFYINEGIAKEKHTNLAMNLKDGNSFQSLQHETHGHKIYHCHCPS